MGEANAKALRKEHACVLRKAMELSECSGGTTGRVIEEKCQEITGGQIMQGFVDSYKNLSFSWTNSDSSCGH